MLVISYILSQLLYIVIRYELFLLVFSPISVLCIIFFSLSHARDFKDSYFHIFHKIQKVVPLLLFKAFIVIKILQVSRLSRIPIFQISNIWISNDLATLFETRESTEWENRWETNEWISTNRRRSNARPFNRLTRANSRSVVGAHSLGGDVIAERVLSA